jgi:hypothetical protein
MLFSGRSQCATRRDHRGEELNDVVEDFHAPFSGPLGAWRLMSELSFRDPAEVLASILDRLPQHLMPTLFSGTHDEAIPEIFARRA